ncbi:ATP-dependent RNA helicase [Diplogelasinospora grovesii]|uniref:RNA helicase n=1 Tax=Diplogelasinospora grovesii TaxID=303347 RepID=A0AAN6S961_9PEZI|nr:ATP-dependent RNA helicase [Diplogelasinospora grovesii]
MWKTARDSVCLLCRSSAVFPPRTTTLLEPAQCRTFATRRVAESGGSRSARPARMVLSDRVARPRPPTGTGGKAGSGSGSKDYGGGDRGDRKPSRRNIVDGPFAAMNRTVANIDRMEGRVSRHKKDDKRKGERKGKGFKALNMQRALTTIGYGQRSSIKERMQYVESFDQFELLPSVKQAVAGEVLKGMVDIKPTPVQRLAIPALLGQDVGGGNGRKKRGVKVDGRREFLLAAETGSGKTLAYLLPAVNAIKVAEEGDEATAAWNKRLEAEKIARGDKPMASWIDNFEPHPNTARPRVVVLVPTAELVEQVIKVAKTISHVAKFKARPLSANYDALKNQRNLYSTLGVDMIVSTPHLLATIAESDPNVLSRVSHLVIDEADSLLDRSFAPETTKVVDRAMPSLKQLVLCSATIPKRLDNYLVDRFPDMTRITTPNLHAIPRRVQLGVIDVSKDPYRNNKKLACADAIWSIGKEAAAQQTGKNTDEVDVKRIMVFVNERETTQEVAEYLVSKGIDAVALHRDTPEHRQSEMLASFTSNEPLIKPAKEAEGGNRRHLAHTKVIVATDLASRGIDTLAVRHVVLYDVPHTTIDFIHRLGRAGRMGRRGRGIVLVGKDDRRDVVAEVKESMFMGQALV